MVVTPRRVRQLIVVALLALVAGSVSAETFRWARTTDPQTMDPHASNSAPVLGFLNNIYDALVRRNADMEIVPSLAQSWEPLGDDGWRFRLREGVRFHDGAALTADDVLFSYQRASSVQSDVRSWFSPVRAVNVIDELTIDFLTHESMPLFPDSIANFMIMDRDWAAANEAEQPARDEENHATEHANGTGAFRLVSRDPGVKTILQPFDDYWDTMQGNITEAVFTPIAQSATGVAALLSGEIDFFSPIPLQDLAGMKQRAGYTVYEAWEARVMMFGFAHQPTPVSSASETDTDARRINPFSDARVRQAAYQSIDVDTLIEEIMQGVAQPASQLVPDNMTGFSAANGQRLAFEPVAAKQLLSDAGYTDGFDFVLRCPNDRYINDQAICKRTASMLAEAGMNAELLSTPVREYWASLRNGDFDMYLLGWSAGTFDAEHPIRFLLATPDAAARVGSWNFGGYSNARIDELLPLIQAEPNNTRRQSMIDEVTAIMQTQVAYVPLYVPPLVWVSRDTVELSPRTDDFLILRWITVNSD